MQGRLQLSEGEEAIRLLGELDTLAMNDSIAKAQLAEKLQLIKTTTAALPVAPFKDTLFFINANLHLIPAKERVATLNKWMKKMYRDPRFTAESLSILDRCTVSCSLQQQRNRISVSEVDALWFSKKAKTWRKI